MKKFRYPLLCGILLVCFSAFPETVRGAVRQGMQTCAEILIPSLFPYFILTNLFVKSGAAAEVGNRLGRHVAKSLRLPPCAVTALLLGLCGGYPLGAKTIAELRKRGEISAQAAQRAIGFCNNAGAPLFLGVLAGLLGSAGAGLALYGVHILSAILVGLLLRGKEDAIQTETSAAPPPPFSAALTKSVSDAAMTMVNVCAFVALFSVVSALLTAPLSIIPAAAVSGALELTGGSLAIAGLPIAWRIKFALLSAAAAWGGLSVHFQSMAALDGCGVKLLPYLAAKALQALLSGVLAFGASYLLSPISEAAVTPHRFAPFSPLPWCILSVGIFFLIFLQIPTGNSEKNVI